VTASTAEPDLAYTYVTLPGAGGSPIFDAATGDLIGIHHSGYPCPNQAIPQNRCAGLGVSITRIVEAIRAAPTTR
jgi:V8-like Glu-specific endopeptidase